MVKSAGDAQTATVNTNVATAPAVTITDTFGNPVAGVSVTGASAVVSAGASTDTVSAAAAFASANGVTLGNSEADGAGSPEIGIAATPFLSASTQADGTTVR